MKNQVIKVLNEEHGARVIEYWKKKGADIKGYLGDVTEDGGYSYIYYGVINDKFDNYYLTNVLQMNAEIIQLPEERTFPRVMMVREHPTANAAKRVVFALKNGKYIAWNTAETLIDAEKITGTSSWLYAEEIDEPKMVELTVSQLLEKTFEIKKIFGIGESDELVIRM